MSAREVRLFSTQFLCLFPPNHCALFPGHSSIIPTCLFSFPPILRSVLRTPYFVTLPIVVICLRRARPDHFGSAAVPSWTAALISSLPFPHSAKYKAYSWTSLGRFPPVRLGIRTKVAQISIHCTLNRLASRPHDTLGSKGYFFPRGDCCFQP